MDYEGICDTVFMVGIPDIDIEILEEYGYTADTYFSEADEQPWQKQLIYMQE